MRQFTFLPALFTLLFLIGRIPVAAQTISSQKGLTTAEFTLPQGQIKVYLPEDIRPGDHISGTVIMEPAGNTGKEKSRNIQLLQKNHVSLVDGITGKQGLSGPFSYTIGSTNLSFTLSANGKIISTLPVPVKSNSAGATNISMPTHALTASPLPIKGQFDGNAENTKCLADGKPVEILAESPQQCIVQFPQTSSGPHSISVTENNKTTEQKIYAVNMDVNAGRLNLQKGETTYIDVMISGLQNLPATATLSVINTSTATVIMTGGDAQIIPIQPATVTETGNFTKRFDLKSVRTGNFSVTVNLDLPEPVNTNSASLCNCYINEQSCLIPLQTCLALGGSTNPSVFNNAAPGNQTSEPSNPPPAILLPPGNITAQTHKVTLQINALKDDVAAVIFSEKPVSRTQWQHAGKAIKDGNNWSADWTPPLGNDGQHIIRARVAGKNNTITELYSGAYLQLTPATINTVRGERINFTVTDVQLNNANQNVQQQAENLRRIQERLAGLRRKLEELIAEMDKNRTMADELAAIDKTLEKIPGLYADSLKKLTDSLAKLKAALPPNPDPADLQKSADDAAQRAKDCEDRLNKLKQEKENAQKELDNLNNEIENLLKQLDALHLGNNWAGGHGYHKDGRFWYGYVGDENSNTNIQGESNAISNKLKGLRKPQNAAKNRIKALDAEIAKAQEECDKLNKEKEKAEDAAKKGNAMAAAETQIDELCRQIQALLDALKKWCAAHPGVCNFNPELAGNPRTAAELDAYLSQLDDIIKKKQQKEADLEKAAEEKASEAQGVGNDIKAAEAEKKAAEEELKKAQAAADKLQADREKQLEEERAKKRKEEEEQAKASAPKPAPTLPEPIEATDKQLKFQALSMLRGLYQDYWIKDGPCDCTTKAIALANNTNTAASDVLGGLAIGIIFAPIESLPGLSLAAKLGVGAVKALGSALYGGESFTDELAKNLFDVIGGEIFPHLLESDIAGNAANKFAGKGLEEIMKEEGIRAAQWEGETTLKECGKVKGKTTMLFNPNTGWVTLLIKIDNCPLIVIKYQVNKDGVPITKPSVTRVQ